MTIIDIPKFRNSLNLQNWIFFFRKGWGRGWRSRWRRWPNFWAGQCSTLHHWKRVCQQVCGKFQKNVLAQGNNIFFLTCSCRFLHSKKKFLIGIFIASIHSIWLKTPALYPNWHELWKQGKCSYLAPLIGTFCMTR